MQMEQDEAWARIEWQAERGGRVVWLSGEEGVETSSLIARAISEWQQSGDCVLFADFSLMADPGVLIDSDIARFNEAVSELGLPGVIIFAKEVKER